MQVWVKHISFTQPGWGGNEKGMGGMDPEKNSTNVMGRKHK